MTAWGNDLPVMAGPTHINSYVVVASIKLPTDMNEPPHQWLVVCERPDKDDYIVHHVDFQKPVYTARSNRFTTPWYDVAVAAMLRRLPDSFITADS
jgi:hypothetical protein